MRGQYVPFQNDPLLYAMGPGHLFFGQGTGTPTPNSPPGTSPLENPATPAFTEGSALEGRTTEPGTAEEFQNPNISYNPVWGNIGLNLANLIGGPVLGGLVGAGIGANMAQGINQQFGSRGLAEPFDVTQAAFSGAARGALGTLGGLAGIGRGYNDLAEIYSTITNPVNQTMLDSYSGIAANAPEGTFGLAIGGLEASADKGSGYQDGGEKGAAKSGGGDEQSATGASYGQGPDASDASGGGYMFNSGGLVALANGGKVAVGPGGGLDDLIPTTIDGRQAARLSDGEFVIPADVVSMFGDGSTTAGSRRLYDLVKTVRREKTGTARQAGPLRVGGILEKVLS